MSADMIFSSFGFCYSDAMRELFAQVIDKEDLRGKSCAVIPFAGFHSAHTGEREAKGLEAFGFDPALIRVITEEDDVIGMPDYIYVAGGDPFKLLAALQKGGLMKEIKTLVTSGRSTYIGVSAGAYVAAPDIRYVTRLEDNNVIGEDFTALGLIPDTVLCHYVDHYSYSHIIACREYASGDVLTVKNVQLLVLENGSYRYVGE